MDKVQRFAYAILARKRTRDLFSYWRAADICGCGNCIRQALRVKEYYDGFEATNEFKENNSLFSTMRRGR